MHDPKIQILNMLSEGRVTPEEADQLLRALEAAPVSPGGSKKPQWLRIRVTEDGEEKVKVNIPLALARMAIALLPARAMVQINAKGIDLERLLDEEIPAAGKLVDIRENGNTVEVYVE